MEQVIKRISTSKYFVKFGSMVKKDDVWANTKAEATVFPDKEERNCIKDTISLRVRYGTNDIVCENV